MKVGHSLYRPSPLQHGVDALIALTIFIDKEGGSKMTGRQKFSGPRMLIFTGLIYAFVGALGLTVAQLTNAYMVLDPEVTMNRTYLGMGFSAFILVQGISAPLIGWTIAKKGAFVSSCG